MSNRTEISDRSDTLRQTNTTLVDYLSKTFSFPCEWRNGNGHMFRTDCANELVMPIEEAVVFDKNTDAEDIKKIVDLWQAEWKYFPLTRKYY